MRSLAPRLLPLVLLIAVPPAWAGEAATVDVPVGEWVGTLADLVGLVVAALAIWALRMLPAPIHRVLMMLRAEQLISRAVDYGVQAVSGAARGRTLTVDVGNRVIATAARYGVESADDVVNWLGGEEALKQKILARLDLEADAEAHVDRVAGVELVGTRVRD